MPFAQISQPPLNKSDSCQLPRAAAANGSFWPPIIWRSFPFIEGAESKDCSSPYFITFTTHADEISDSPPELFILLLA